MRARHTGTPELSKEARDHLCRANGLHGPTPPRNQTQAQGAKSAAALSGTAGRKALPGPKSKPGQRMDTIPDTLDQLDATLNVAKAIGKATPMNLASAKAAASTKSASAKPGTVSLGLKGGGKSPSPGKSRAKSPAAGGSVKRPPAKQLGARSPKSPVKATVFNFGAKPTTPPGGQLPAIAGISSLPKDQVEQNTPASKVDQSMDDSRAADWNQLDEDATEEPMPPPARVTPKSKPQSKPTGAVAPKPGGPGDVLHFETARRQAAKEATQAKFWQKAYEAMLRAEHGWRMNFANMPGEPEKPVPEELMVEMRTQYQK